MESWFSELRSGTAPNLTGNMRSSLTTANTGVRSKKPQWKSTGGEEDYSVSLGGYRGGRGGGSNFVTRAKAMEASSPVPPPVTSEVSL